MAILRMIWGQHAGRVFDLSPGRTVIGRDPDCCDVVLAHNAVSRQHASIDISDEQGFITDLGSRNGTLVNGEQLDPGPDGRRQLLSSDWIEINGFCLAYEDDPSSDSTVLITSDATMKPLDLGTTATVSSSSSDPRLTRHAESKLRAVLGIMEETASAIEPKDVLPKVLDSLMRSFRYARCALVALRDAASREYVPIAVRRRDGRKEPVRLSSSIVGHVAGTRTAILSRDVGDDDRFGDTSSVYALSGQSIMCAPLLDKDGEAVGVIQLIGVPGKHLFTKDDLDVLAGVARHISIVIENARLHESTLREQRSRYETRFQNLIENSIQGVLIHRRDKPLFVNGAYANVHGYSVEDILQMESILPLIAEDERRPFASYVDARLRGENAPTHYEYHGLRKDGTTVWLDSISAVVDWGGEQAIQSTIVDVSKRKKAEQELSASEEMRRSVMESSPDFIMMLDRDGTIQFINRVRPELTFEQVLGSTVYDYTPEQFHPATKECLAHVWESGETGRFETQYHDPHGEVHYFETRVAPLMEDGVVAALVAQATEITARKQAELELKRAHDELELRVEERTAELARSNRDLEQFAYSVSHDLQEPLRSVTGFCGLLKRRYDGKLDQEADDFINFAIEGGQRMETLIKDLLYFSRVTTRAEAPQPTDSRDVLDAVVENLQAVIEDSGAVVTRGELPVVTADRTQLSQVFQNLIENAIKFRGERAPCIHVEARTSAGEVVFAVRDNGIGIDPEKAGEIFAVFRRLHTRDEYPGTGIGLSICRKVVERHGGRIWVESAPGQGSVFLFTLMAPR